MNVKFYLFSCLILLCVFSKTSAQTPPPKITYENLNEKAVYLPDPIYPPAARAVRAYGAVQVQVTVDENGDVVNAQAVSGHPLLRTFSVQAARQAKFVPWTVDGKTFKFTGTLVYIFVFQEQWQAIGEALGDAEIEIEDADNLSRAADILATAYPEISKSIKTVGENFIKDEQAARSQTGAIGDIIGQIQIKLANRTSLLWHFEFGLTVGRIRANYFDESVLRVNLPRLKELTDSYSSAENQVLRNEEWSENLRKLGEMANQPFYSRKDKSKIKKLIANL